MLAMHSIAIAIVSTLIYSWRSTHFPENWKALIRYCMPLNCFANTTTHTHQFQDAITSSPVDKEPNKEKLGQLLCPDAVFIPLGLLTPWYS